MIGVVLVAFESVHFIGQLLLSVAFASAIAFLAPVFRGGRIPENCGVALPLVMGLGAFAAGPFLDVGDLGRAVALFWGIRPSSPSRTTRDLRLRVPSLRQELMRLEPSLG